MRRLLWAAGAVLVLLGACASSTTFGPVRMDVPEGWQVTRRSSDSFQLAQGTAASDTDDAPGTATAVFDVYLSSDQTPDGYRERLREGGVGAKVEEWTVNGEKAVVLSYEGPATAGPQEAVIFPSRRVLIVYRAAFPNDRAAFNKGLPAFRRTVRSIEFIGPADRRA
ncbi:MAG TPA: hypothetical protein VM840_11295 [Actinomycetota bacterium]|nr:hypothetical protein [Actinomycetota bacterium]